MPSRRARRSPLFSAVVLAGASLTTQALEACGGEEAKREPSDASSATSSSSGSGTSGTSGTSGFSGASSGTTSGGTSSGNPTPPSDAGTCPDGSERPVPPCNYIR